MKVNLTKKDLECIFTGCTGHYLIPPDEYDRPDQHKKYNQWQKTCYKISDALAEMEKGK
tara:strand:- start:1959 stop:2135 length:177 start_codon:yes stop_codon:yes gene_type:complete